MEIGESARVEPPNPPTPSSCVGRAVTSPRVGSTPSWSDIHLTCFEVLREVSRNVNEQKAAYRIQDHLPGPSTPGPWEKSIQDYRIMYLQEMYPGPSAPGP